MAEAEEEEENDFVAPTPTTTTIVTTTMTTTTPHPPFEAGDHVVLPCNAAGGLIPYEHHAIVVSVGQEICGGWTLCVSDFTIDGGDDGGDGGMMVALQVKKSARNPHMRTRRPRR